MTASPWKSMPPRFPKLTSDITVDVAVIGAGMTGISAAYLLSKAGLRVAVLEKNRWGCGDTGCTTAHLTYVTDKRAAQLLKEFGRDHAEAAWDAGRAALAQIDENIQAHGIDCDFAWVPAYLHGSLDDGSERDDASLRRDAEAAADMGFDGLLVDRSPLIDRPAVRFGNQALFHPLKYLAGLIGEIPRHGGSVFEDSAVDKITDDPLTVHVGNHRVSCGFVVIATHVPLMGKTGFVSATILQSKIAPYTSYAVGATLPAADVSPALYWDTADPYHYLRIERRGDRGYAILGGEDHKTGQADDTEQRLARLESLLRRLLPRASIDARWSGQVIETNDGLPYIGQTADRQFVATGFAGNGMTFGTVAGIMARDTVLGIKCPWQELFDTGRTKLRGGAWDYLKENVDYPYYMVKDHLTAAERQSPDAVRPGEGKILRLENGRAAVSRDERGQLHSVSPICTHMGCIVHWNDTEKSWDCPCHGSRFSPAGEVLAGPAETPLAKVPLKGSVDAG
jgi:glycine/D-amino acid oxidase-like deaminating enzyme/nitrite reductase/ring-hydroxylating ferredoxin subunit